MRVCTVCLKSKSEDLFQRRSKHKLTGRCKKCVSDKLRESQRTEEFKRVRALRIAQRYEIINAAKSQPCVDCGNTFPPECMDFDHLGNKLYTIADMKSAKIETLIAEIAKCEIVCANCHRIRTKSRGYKENKIRFSQRVIGV